MRRPHLPLCGFCLTDALQSYEINFNSMKILKVFLRGVTLYSLIVSHRNTQRILINDMH